MAKITVITGFGYFKNDLDQIAVKSELPAGEYELAAGLQYVEVANKETLDAIEIYRDPELAKEEADRAKMQEALEKLAIAELKKDSYVFESIKYEAK